MKGFRLFAVRGIDVRINWSVFVIATLVAWSLADTVLPDADPGAGETAYWVTAALATVGFFAALVAHEFGHAVEAQRDGIQVRSVTLWVLGGVAELGGRPSGPRAALRVAAAGPIVSFVLGVIGLVVWPSIDGVDPLAGAAVGWFAMMNLILAVFNLLPAFPLDGGRIYQAFAWSRTGDELQATTGAARLGTIVGSVMVVGGLALAMFGGNLGGIWFVAIGWFLRDAALAELESMRVMQTMHRYTARDVMSPVPHTVPFDLTIREFVAFADLHGRHAYYPVLEENVLVGLASIAAVGAHEPERWDEMSIGGLVQPIGYCVVVDADIALDDLLTQLAGRDETRALVVEDGELVGIVAPSDVARLATGPFAEARVSRTTRSAAPAGP